MTPHRPQRGATLIIALIMLVMMLLLATAASNLLMLDQQGARNWRDLAVARLAAQAALDDAIDDLALHLVERDTDTVYGSFTGRKPPGAQDNDAPAAPRYRIEEIPATTDKRFIWFRVTATGHGPDQAHAVLQAVARAAAPAQPPDDVQLLAWRDISAKRRP